MITTRDEGTCRIVAPAGELDIATAAELREALDAQQSAGHSRIVIDLAEVTFIDSSGIGAIVAAHKAFDEQGTRLSLAAASDRLQKVFRLAGLADTLGLAESVSAACAQP